MSTIREKFFKGTPCLAIWVPEDFGGDYYCWHKTSREMVYQVHLFDDYLEKQYRSHLKQYIVEFCDRQDIFRSDHWFYTDRPYNKMESHGFWIIGFHHKMKMRCWHP